MKILSIHSGHNASVALMIDGKIHCAWQEERFTGIKNQQGFPLNSLKFILNDFLEGDINSIDEIVHPTFDFRHIKYFFEKILWF